jgi:gluconolactonase
VFGTLPAGTFPDSLCLDGEGYVLVAGILSNGTVVFAPDGKLDQILPSEDKVVTNVAFGGPNFTTLYITESGLGRLVTHEWGRRGLVLFPDRQR